MKIEFKNKVAIVTGAGGGLGREYALELGKRGAKVLVNDFGGAVDGSVESESTASAKQTVKMLHDIGVDAVANGADVTDEQMVEQMVQQCVNEFGGVDILINNAGILIDKTFSKLSMSSFRKVFDVHVWGSVLCTNAVWDLMKEKQYGRIVMTSSPSGLYGSFGQSNYSAAKMALVGFMKTLSLEGAKYGINVNAIAPVAQTRMTEGIFPEDLDVDLHPKYTAQVVAFLASEQAPNAEIVGSCSTNVSSIQIMENEGINFLEDFSVETIADSFQQIKDTSFQQINSGAEQSMKLFSKIIEKRR